MKTTSVLAIVSLLSIGSPAVASEHHEADEGLEKTLRAEVNEHHVHIHVHKGVVTLEGQVPSDSERQRVESIVRSTGGVVAVKDELRVALPAPEYSSGYAPAVPVYTAPPPEVVPPAPVVTVPPVVVPEYPRVKVQAWTDEDQPVASRILQQFRTDSIPTRWLEDVNVTVRHGDVILKGVVESQERHDAIIAAVQHAGGMRAIYDQIRVRPAL